MKTAHTARSYGLASALSLLCAVASAWLQQFDEGSDWLQRGTSVYDLAAALWGLETRGASLIELRRRLYELCLPGEQPPQSTRSASRGELPQPAKGDVRAVLMDDARATIRAVRTITLDDPEFAGTYAVECLPDGRLLLEPDTGPSEEEILQRVGGRVLTPEEFAAEFGEPPAHGEG